MSHLSQAEVSGRAARIRVVAFDVDGVCTDGRLYYGKDGEVLHAFHARDGLGIALARTAGIILVAISGRVSANVQARLSELKVPHIRQGIMDKASELSNVLAEIGADWSETAFIGDDVNDLACIQRAGLGFCPADAADDVPARAHVVTRRRGGEGALREVIECVLKARGLWRLEGEAK